MTHCIPTAGCNHEVSRGLTPPPPSTARYPPGIAHAFQLGAFMEKQLTMRGGQTPVQRYWTLLLDKVRTLPVRLPAPGHSYCVVASITPQHG